MTDTTPVRRERPNRESVSERPDMRAPMREDDSRARAAARAAELRGHIGDMDEGTDDFFIDQDDIPDGWSYEWKTKSVMGKEDPAYAVQIARRGWEAVPATRHPSYMPGDNTSPIIERKGMILMERPLDITEESRSIELKRARQQMRQKEAQLNAAPQGQFSRDEDPRTRAKINKSYEPMAIPE